MATTERTWTEYYASDREVLRLQDIARSLDLTGDAINGLHEMRKTSEKRYPAFRRKVLGAYYKLFETSGSKSQSGETLYKIFDNVNHSTEDHINEQTFKFILENENIDYTSQTDLDQNAICLQNAYKDKRDVLDNNINYCELNFFTRLLFRFRRFRHAYHSEPLKSTIVTSIFVAALIYLKGGILNFTPISSILLVGIIVLAGFLLSSTFYVKTINLLSKIAEDGPENSSEHGSKSNSYKFFSSMCCNVKFQLTALLWLAVVASTAYFLVAAINSFTYSIFLTPTASSFLLFPTTLWGCFAFAVVSSLVLYTISAAYFKMYPDQTTHGKLAKQESYEFFGVACKHKSVTELLTATTCRAYNAVGALVGEGAKLVMNNTEQERNLITGSLAAATTGNTATITHGDNLNQVTAPQN